MDQWPYPESSSSKCPGERWRRNCRDLKEAEDRGQSGSPSDSLDQPKGYPGQRQRQGKAPIESFKGKGQGDSLEKISPPSGLPARVVEGVLGCVP